MIASVSYGQATFRSFKIDNRELIWQEVYDTAVSVDDADRLLQLVSNIRDVRIADDYIVADIVDMPIDFRKYGMKWANTPIVVQAYNVEGRIKIDFKEQKYRVTLFGLQLKTKPDLSSQLYAPQVIL